MRKIQANTITGFYEVEDFDENLDELTDENILMTCLKDCGEDETIYAEVTDEIYDKIKKEYGIKSLARYYLVADNWIGSASYNEIHNLKYSDIVDLARVFDIDPAELRHDTMGVYRNDICIALAED